MGQYANEALLAVQKALVATAQASVLVKAELGETVRLHDRVPTSPVFPYASFGPFDALDASDGCHDGAEVFVQVDVWSRAVGRVEALRIAAVLSAVFDTALAVTDHEVIVHELLGVSSQTGRDGLTTQAILRLRYELAPST